MLANSAVTIIDLAGNSAVVTSGSTSTASGLMVAGSDGAIAHFLLTDTSGRQIITGSVNVSGSFGSQDSSGRQYVVGTVASGSTAQGNPLIIAGVDSAGVVRALLLDSSGRTQNSSSGSVSIGIDVSGSVKALATDSYGTVFIQDAAVGMLQGRFTGSFAGSMRGKVVTNATTEAAIRQTTYTEQTGSVQRSLNSLNASDSSAGTGARTVKVTYYVSGSGASSITGPFTEDVTLNGTTAQNMTATNVCYVESLEVITAGSNGSNVGAIQIFTTTAGGGSVFGSIAAGARRTNWCHHYVASGRTMYMQSLYASSTAASSNQEHFAVRSQSTLLPNAAERFVIDDITTEGSSPALLITFSTPHAVVGPAKVIGYVTPDNGPVQTNSLSVDYIEY